MKKKYFSEEVERSKKKKKTMEAATTKSINSGFQKLKLIYNEEGFSVSDYETKSSSKNECQKVSEEQLKLFETGIHESNFDGFLAD